MALTAILAPACSKKAKEPSRTEVESFESPLIIGSPEGTGSKGWHIEKAVPPTGDTKLEYEVVDGKLKIHGQVAQKNKLILTQLVGTVPDTRVELRVNHRVEASIPGVEDSLLPDPQLLMNPSRTDQTPMAFPPVGVIGLLDETTRKGAGFFVYPRQVLAFVNPMVTSAHPAVAGEASRAPAPEGRHTTGAPHQLLRIVSEIQKGSWHTYAISYDPVALKVRMSIDGKLVLEQEQVAIPKPTLNLGTLAPPGAPSAEANAEVEFDNLEIAH